MRFTKGTSSCVLALLLLVTALPFTVRAEEPETPGEGALHASTSDGKTVAVPLERTDVRATIAATTATVEVRQLFTNRSKEPIEALYLYPLPPNAAVVDMTARIGGRTIRSEIKERDAARAAYAAAVASGRHAAIVEQRSGDLYTSKVANVRPGDRIEIELRYVQALEYDGGAYQFKLPLVVRERAKRVAAAAPTATPKSKVTDPRYVPEGTRPGTNLSIQVDVDAGVPIVGLSSASHQISIQKRDEHRSTVRLARRNEIPNRDFALEVRVAGDAPTASAMATKAPDGGAYFTINAVPPADAFSSGVVKKEIVFVVDTSGSMEGERIREAKNALLALVRGLNHGDAFNIVRFSSDFSSFQPAPVMFTQKHVDAVDAYIDALVADGGTTAAPALRHALAQPSAGKRLRIVAFLTDGQLNDHADVEALVENDLGQNRLFTFGIGPAPDDFLSRRMAQAGRGASRFVLPGQQMQSAISGFQNDVAAPVLTDVKVSLEGARVLDATPSPIPDLFAARPLTIHGKADRLPSGRATIEATGPNGPVRFSVPVEVKSGREAEAIGAIYARSRVAGLLDRMREEGNSPELRAEIVALGLEHHIVTPWTAFVLVDDQPVVPEGTKAKKTTVPLARPEAPKEDGTAPSELRVRVVDPSGVVVPGATIELSDGQRCVTDGVGECTFDNLPASGISVVVSAPGFATTQHDGLAGTRAVEMVLHPAGIAEAITVTTSDEPIVDVTSTMVATNVAEEDLDAFSSTAALDAAPPPPPNAPPVAQGIGVGGGFGSGSRGGAGRGVGRAQIASLPLTGRRPMPLTFLDSDGGRVPTQIELLLRTQLVSGAWADRVAGETVDDEIAITAAAVLAFLADGHTDRAGGYQAQVRRALDFLATRVGHDGVLIGATSPHAKALTLRALERAAKMTGSAYYAAAVRRLAPHVERKPLDLPAPATDRPVASAAYSSIRDDS